MSDDKMYGFSIGDNVVLANDIYVGRRLLSCIPPRTEMTILSILPKPMTVSKEAIYQNNSLYKMGPGYVDQMADGKRYFAVVRLNAEPSEDDKVRLDTRWVEDKLYYILRLNFINIKKIKP